VAEETQSVLDELARLRAENWRLSHALEEERERFRHTVQTPLIGFLLSSFERSVFLDTNQAYCKFLGFERAELLAKDPYKFWSETTHPEDQERELVELKRLVSGESDSYRIEKRHIRKNGEVRWGEVTLSSIRDARGRVRQNVLACVDIHEQKQRLLERERLESSLLQAQKLESVGRLVGGVAHDFNNRLVVIMGHADLLRRAAADEPVLTAHADMVVSSARRAADLTRQLLAYTRRQVLRPQATDINPIVDRTRRMLDRLIGEHIEVVTVLEAKHPMLADSGQIEQVLMNLTLNARDAMPSGGRITLHTLDVDVTSEAPTAGLEPGTYVALEVSDTGTGISKETLQHLFEPFFTTKEVGQGTGLGLASVDGIVRQSGGSVSVKSVEGQGSTFTVYLPRAQEQAVETTIPASTRSNHVPCVPQLETVLVVDDEEDVRQLLAEVLRLGSYRVLEARNPEQAVKVVQAHSGSLGLLITDIVMPGSSGMELADTLRETRPDLKVLFMSGYAERQRLRGLHGNEHYIPKPFLPDELFQRVNDILAEPAHGVEKIA